MSKRVGVVLSGCGVYDGSEIQEAVSILIALDKQGAQTICMAPDIPQRGSGPNAACPRWIAASMAR